MMIVLKGADVSAKIKLQVEAELKSLGGYIPTLAIVRVGEKPDDLSYERGAIKKIEAFGMKTSTYTFKESVSHQEFKEQFKAINEDSAINGILLLRPLPKQICEAEIEKMIDPKKDLDGISPDNIAKVFLGDKSGFAPCTAEAVIEVLKLNNIDLVGKNVVIVGRSMVVGKPLSMLMLKENATITVCHTRTVDMEGICRRADIVVAAAGKAKLVNQNYIGKDAIVIDVGINVDQNGKLCGDVDFEAIFEQASMATPVPGGVGAVTTAVLAKHLVRSCK